jgi:hypothetical protein
MPGPESRARAVVRGARHFIRRIARLVWRVVRVVLVASAAMGPAPPPPPLPRPPPIEARADDGQTSDEARR